MIFTDEEIMRIAAAKKKQNRQEYMKSYLKKWKAENKDKVRQYRRNYAPVHRRKMREQRNSKPFLGVDGEGAGEGLSHIYWLLRVGDSAIWHEDGSELSSIEILKWLADLGASGINNKFIPVSFFFDYDTSMILRHLPEKNLKELMYNGTGCVRNTCKHSRREHFGNRNCSRCDCRSFLYGGQTTVFLDPKPDTLLYLRIRLTHRQFKVAWGKKPYFTVTDVGDLFQSSFVKVLEKWQHGEEGEPDLLTDEELQYIRKNKERRGSFEIGFDLETFDYNKMECELLSNLMSRFRKMCYDNNIVPDMWTGPGRLAEDIFKIEKVPLRESLDLPPIIETLGDYAYFGGRMEGIHFGLHHNIYSYDIASAYPHAYLVLPCLLKGHGKWEEVSFEEVEKNHLTNTLVMGRFTVRDLPLEAHSIICGLPMRDKRGAICFPTDAHGIWWYPEVEETIRLYDSESIEYTKKIYKCLTWRQTCDDRPGDFISKWYDKRIQVGKSTRGIPIKLALNSLYGKSAQRVGAAKWANVVWAGLLTSITRARLLSATRTLGISSIVSYQTDGIFSKTRGLPSVTENAHLGEWEEEKYDEIFLIQSGVYSAKQGEKTTNKTRGMRDFEFSAAQEDIRSAWDKDKWFGAFDLPQRNTFVTIKLGLMWGKPQLIGCWIKQDRRISFRSNMDKREIFDLNCAKEGMETKDGRTFAPGKLHQIQLKKEYGPHPLEKLFRESGMDDNVIASLGNFSYPYTRELASALREEERNKEITYSYITPDEPYILEE